MRVFKLVWVRIKCFHSRGQHLCKFIGTKESVCIKWKEFNSHRPGLGHQHPPTWPPFHCLAAVTSCENTLYINRALPGYHAASSSPFRSISSVGRALEFWAGGIVRSCLSWGNHVTWRWHPSLSGDAIPLSCSKRIGEVSPLVWSTSTSTITSLQSPYISDIKLINGPKADVSGAILPLTSYCIVNREIQNHVYRKRQNANLNNVTIDHFSFSNLRNFQLESEV